MSRLVLIDRIAMVAGACVLAGVVTAVAAATGGAGIPGADEKKIPIEQVPPVPRAVILEAVGDGRIVDVGEITRRGTVLRYEVECIKDGREIDIVVGPDGTLLTERDEGAAAEGRGEGDGAVAWRSTFDIDKAKLVPTGRNAYFPLVPGHRVHLAGGNEMVIVTVLDETLEVDGVVTRIVEEREYKSEKLAEVSRNYFAMDPRTKDVYYFGEDVDMYDETGAVIGHGGAWRSGVDGARFGLIMPGRPRPGDRYYQELAPEVAMDRAEVVELDADLETPMKPFKGCLYIRESSAIESGFSHKWYAPGIGMIGDDDLRVVKVESVERGSD